MMLETNQYLASLRDSVDLIAKVAHGNLARPVPSCPNWTMSHLVWHCTRVHNAIVQIVVDKVQGFDKLRPYKRVEDDVLINTFVDGATSLIDVFKSTPPDTEIWSWVGPAPLTWAIRRMTQETMVHAWDAATAIGPAPTMPGDMASDGIDEFLHNFLRLQRESMPAPGGSVHIHCTDVHGEWFIDEPEAGNIVITREHAKGTCAIRGNASQLLLVLWRRQPLSTVEVIGAQDVAERFVERTAL